MKPLCLLLILALHGAVLAQQDVPRAFRKYEEPISPQDQQFLESAARQLMNDLEFSRRHGLDDDEKVDSPDVAHIKNKIQVAELNAVERLNWGRNITVTLALLLSISLVRSFAAKWTSLRPSTSLRPRDLRAKPLLYAAGGTLATYLIVAMLVLYVVFPLFTRGWFRVLISPSAFACGLLGSLIPGMILGKTCKDNLTGHAMVFGMGLIATGILAWGFSWLPGDPILYTLGFVLEIPLVMAGASAVRVSSPPVS